MYEGIFENGKMIKIVKVHFPNQIKFFGTFVDDIPNGLGKFYIPKYGTLVGYWKQGHLYSLDYASFKYF